MLKTIENVLIDYLWNSFSSKIITFFPNPPLPPHKLHTHLLDKNVPDDKLALCYCCLDQFPSHMTFLVDMSGTPLPESDLLCLHTFQGDKETDYLPLYHLDNNNLHSSIRWHLSVLPEDRSNQQCMEYSSVSAPPAIQDCTSLLDKQLV